MECAKVKRVTFLGSGGFATSLAIHLARGNRACVIWGKDSDYCNAMAVSRVNGRHLPGVPIPDSVLITADFQKAIADCDLLIASTPTAYLRQTLDRVAIHVPDSLPVLSLVKGLERETLKRPSQIVEDVLGSRRVAVLSGPSHAEEVAQGRPTSLVISSESEDLAETVQKFFGFGPLRLYRNDDPTGVELAGALKNIMGIAAGLCDGLDLGDNAKAALLSRGLIEMTRFAVAHGAQARTFFGLAGVGDLMTTCFSGHGRNRSLGRWLATGMTLDQITKSTTHVFEGAFTTFSVADSARRCQIPMPITEAVENILTGSLEPWQAVKNLMNRPSGSEYDDLDF
jgi:glycerol-3-phosphate dehydrogenase (NAD(P)+)